MSEYLVRASGKDGFTDHEEVISEELALERLRALAASGASDLRLYLRVALAITTSIRIIKRRKGTPAPAKEATPPPLPGAGGSSPEKQLSTKGCPAPECPNAEPCALHKEVDKSIRREWLKARKADREARAASAPESAK